MEFLMGVKAQLKLDVVHKVELGKIDRRRACLALDVSERTLERYIANYRREGALFTRHGNDGRVPINKTEEKIKEQVLNLIREKYHDFNMSHAREKLLEDEKIKIKRETLRKWCHEINHVKRKKRKRSIARYYRQRMAQRGMLVQMDGSVHRWFGNKQSTLIAAIDDADSTILYAEFFPAEDTISCMSVLQKVVERKGAFNILYVDKAGIFGGAKRMEFSQVTRALEELAIQTIYAHSPEAKGRVERLFGTLQDRLIPEMRLRGIKSYPQANRFLQEQYIPQEWQKKFTVKPQSNKTEFRKISKKIDLKEVFCLKHFRTVARDHTISLDGKIYQLTSPTRFSIYKQLIEIRTYQDLKWLAYYAGQPIKLIYLDDHQKYRAVG